MVVTLIAFYFVLPGLLATFDALPRQQFSARRMPLARFLIPAERGRGDIGAQFLGQCAVVRGEGAIFFAVDGDFAVEPRSAHPCHIPVCRNLMVHRA